MPMLIVVLFVFILLPQIFVTIQDVTQIPIWASAVVVGILYLAMFLLQRSGIKEEEHKELLAKQSSDREERIKRNRERQNGTAVQSYQPAPQAYRPIKHQDYEESYQAGYRHHPASRL